VSHDVLLTGKKAVVRNDDGHQSGAPVFSAPTLSVLMVMASLLDAVPLHEENECVVGSRC